MKRESGFSRARRSRRSTRRRPFRSRWRSSCRPFNQLSRQRADRQSTNNLKQIGLALHNFRSANDHFPADIRGKDGKPLLSWRVAILPFIEQQALFNEFHLDEPWDSTHNKTLIEHMPATSRCPAAARPSRARPFIADSPARAPCSIPWSGNGVQDRQHHGWHVQHDRGRRSQGGRSLDQARERDSLRTRSSRARSRSRSSSPWAAIHRRVQCPVLRRVCALHSRDRESPGLASARSLATAAKSSLPTRSERSCTIPDCVAAVADRPPDVVSAATLPWLPTAVE